MGLVAKAFQDIITFSRASSGTYVNSNGYITNSSVLNYLTYSNQPENAAWTKSNSFVQQNLLLYSEDFTNAAWAATDLTVTANAAIAPNGTLTADLFTEGSGGTAKISQSITGASANATFCASINLARGNNDWYRILIYDTVTDTNRISAWVNLATGVVGSATNGGTATGATVSMVSAGTGYYKIVVTGAVNNSVSALTYYIASASANLSATRVSGATVYAWGAQLVQGSVPGDYRATTSAALPCLYADYNGALRARKFCENAANAQHYMSETTDVVAGTVYTFSFRVKAGEKTQATYTWSTASSAFASGTAAFNLATGVVTPSGAATGTMTLLGNGWYLCTSTNTCTATVASSSNYVSFTGLTAYTGDGSSGIYIADAQLNDGSSALAYYDTTASAYNAPRFDYDPVTLAAKGLLVEESRANLLLYSNDWSNAVWAKTNITRTAAAALGPDGTFSMTKLEATASAGTSCSQAVVATATSHTYSIYVKQGSAATDANSFLVFNTTTATVLAQLTVNYATGVITQTVGTGATAVNSGNSIWRIIIPVTSGITIGNSIFCYSCFAGAPETAGEFAYASQAQFEAGAFATSVIPTVASQVTRAADVASVNTLSPWYNSVAGTFYAEYDTTVLRVGSTAVYNVVSADAGNSNNQIALYNYSNFAGGRVVTGGLTQADINGGGSPTNDATIKSGIAYAVNNVAVTANGAAPGTDASVTLPTVDRISLGQVASTGFLNGHLRRITYYPRRLTNAELQTLTTL